MKRLLLQCACLIFSTSITAAADPIVAIELSQAQQDPDFAVQGEYQSPANSENAKGLQVVALGEGEFRSVVYEGGLPGAGWNRKAPQVFEDDRDATQELIKSIGGDKQNRKSPTLGMKAPSGAVVLFDGTEVALQKHWQSGAKRDKNGNLMQGATSIDTFRDFIAHIEFMTPYMPHARGQGRGNSGIYYQGRYETQVLDSFGLQGKNNETGGIYEIRDPDLNMCFPPLTWQTYDVEFTAARWDSSGQKTKNAMLTVRLNGVVVQRGVEIPRITRAAPVKESPEPGPIYIQDHGNPVRFRNIWVLPRDADQEALRPRIPGFERFLAEGSNEPSGGSLLVGELGCVNCHRLPTESANSINTKQAPILTNVGKRIRPQWMMEFIANPHVIKPGTTMPNLFSGWDEAAKNEAVLALANFLSASGRPAELSPDSQAVNRGRGLFHEVGCTACHAPQEGAKVAVATSVPLANLPEKYSVGSLRDFLRDPHAVRPSGRMPSLNLQQKEPEDLAHYLAGGKASHLPPNVKYQAYHGSWESLPNFDELTPVSSGLSGGFDLSVAGRNDNFGIRFDGYLLAKSAGNYRFWLGSDDGSALYIDGTKVTDVDGIHPHSVKEAGVDLAAGVHQIRVEYFELGGEESLSFDVQIPGGTRQDAALLLTLNEDGSPIEPVDEEAATDSGKPLFLRDASLVEKGKELFATLGCSNCHEHDSTKTESSRLMATEFVKLNTEQGCLETVDNAKSLPNFDLSPAQQQAISSLLTAQSVPEPENQIYETMVRFNCYACHERSTIGGPEFDRNPLFVTTQHEMGDEGRIPPPLNGVGDKLNHNWLNQVLANGANDRPYMRTRMPKFGQNNIGHLAQEFIAADRREEATDVEFEMPSHRVKSTGRELVGDQALACIKCHTFGPHRATGIQALSLTEIHKRVREDWFRRYLYEPAKYRPGTRMPTGFPNGQAVVRDVLDGDPEKQIAAIWSYLEDGTKAGIPDGLIAQMIELKPIDEPIIYRNFIEGLTPRGIAVGYPEKAHLAWDANDLCMKLIWHGRFIDASKHWVGRGPGNQVPLGDHQMQLEPTIPLAILTSQDTPWPTQSPRQQSGFQFKGYRLNAAGQPAFIYETPFSKVVDFPEPVAGSENDGSFRRQLTIDVQERTENLYFRAGVGKIIETVPGGFRIDDAMTISIEGGSIPVVRKSGGQMELIVPIDAASGEITITQTIGW